eukprot:6196379-Pleurochrysis_carterae.AAC.8
MDVLAAAATSQEHHPGPLATRTCHRDRRALQRNRRRSSQWAASARALKSQRTPCEAFKDSIFREGGTRTGLRNEEGEGADGHSEKGQRSREVMERESERGWCEEKEEVGRDGGSGKEGRLKDEGERKQKEGRFEARRKKRASLRN